MARVQLDERGGGSFLLQLLYFAGWTVEIRKGRETTIRAARDGVHLEVIAASLAQASGVVFARAMRSRASGAGRRFAADEVRRPAAEGPRGSDTFAQPALRSR